MKSICIKVNNQKEIDYLLKIYDNNYIENTKIRIKKFKIYYNFFIHYLENDDNNFLYNSSNVLSKYIISRYEKMLIKRCINANYFYFGEYEKDLIIKIALRILELQELEFCYKEEILTNIIFDYLVYNKKIYVEGFVNFRLKEYIEILDYLVELSVMNYLKFL